MQRRYNREHYRSRVELIKQLMPNACVGADVIVGFPGETDEDFEETYQFIASLDMSYLHVFTYSERPGTKASLMPARIDVHERRERNERLRILSEKKLRAFYETQIGHQVDVVLEGRSINCSGENAINEGYSDNYVRVKFANDIPSNITSVLASLTAIDVEHMNGEMIDILSTRSSHTIELPILA
jgi:threonylcarbamoyladenosine tRNA methylthiotransferase MtaB